MKLRKFAALLAVLSLLPAVPVLAEESDFEVVYIPCSEGEEYFETNYSAYDRLFARYADDKTPIAMSDYYNGYLYAMVPKEYAEREIESFIAEERTFSDYPDPDKENTYPYHMMRRMSYVGVVEGDENGNALPHNNITRAEAVAMIMRFLGFGSFTDTDSGFLDVSEDSWYAAVVAAARKRGIISGDSETEFGPQREVSREEFMAMTARAMIYSGMKKSIENPEVEEAEDLAQLSPWAYEAYAILKGRQIADYEFGNGEDDAAQRFYRPKQPAKRGEAAELLWRIAEFCMIFPSKEAIEFGFDKEMPVIDGSTSTYPFTQAIYTSLFRNGWEHSELPKQHSKSHASYQRLIKGEVDVIIASVYPAEDIVQMAKDNGVELELVPIAYDAMVFFTNADNDAEGLTIKQISEIYIENKYKNWSELGAGDALFYPYCRNYDSGSHSQMQRHFLNGKDIHEDIRKESTSVAMADVLTDVMGAKTDEPKGFALGYSIYYYYHNMNRFYDTETQLKLLSIDGVYPTDETIADGSYPLSNNTYVVLRSSEPEGSPARRLAEFMLTDLGQTCVELAGFGPLKQ